jgi:hypothetical protein
MNGDQLPLDAFLAAARRTGVAPEWYAVGYKQGFLEMPPPWFFPLNPEYGRGYRAGELARARGAHQSYDRVDGMA